jgi:hypothetical protein
MLRHAPEQDSGQATAAALAQHDQVNGFALRDIQDERGGIAEPSYRLDMCHAHPLDVLLGAPQNLA